MRNAAIIAKPTATVSGMNSERTGSRMRNVGMNTDRMQSMANNRDVTVAASLRRTARATNSVCCICTWVFSTVTIAMSTRMPIDSANPPSDMMLIVLPVSHRPTRAAVSAKRNAHHHHDHGAHVAQKDQDHQARSSSAPIAPSVATLLMAARTVGDSSNS